MNGEYKMNKSPWETENMIYKTYKQEGGYWAKEEWFREGKGEIGKEWGRIVKKSKVCI